MQCGGGLRLKGGMSLEAVAAKVKRRDKKKKKKKEKKKKSEKEDKKKDERENSKYYPEENDRRRAEKRHRVKDAEDVESSLESYSAAYSMDLKSSKRPRGGANDSDSSSSSDDNESIGGGRECAKVAEEDDLRGLTLAQRRFELKRREREQARIQQMISKTHREKIDEFNEKLSKLTEHNDIPKTSAAGNG